MDIKGTDGDDTLGHSALTDDWDNYFGLAGNDTIRLYQGAALGGKGNDRIERLASTDWWRRVDAAYWDSPAPVVVDLEAGWAEDGWGTRDTLVGISGVSHPWLGGSSSGSAGDNTFSLGGGGNNVIDGRGGSDVAWLPIYEGREALDDFIIQVGIDGNSATVTHRTNAAFKAQLTNVERIGIGYDTSVALASFIKPEDMAIAGLLGPASARWNSGAAPGTATALTFSFVTAAPASGVGAAGFAPFSAAQQQAVRAILEQIASVTGLSFREEGGAGANLRFGASAQESTRGVSTMPGEAGAGQVWIDSDTLRDLTPGTEGYAVLLHEIGHALGLRHPRNVDPADNYTSQWRAGDDVTARTVMSQSISSDGLYPSGWGGYDIVALRQLYGARSANAGDTTYLLDAARFGAQSSIVDDGGTDRIDASRALTGVAIDLGAGRLSSAGTTAGGMASIDNLAIAPGTLIENATGSNFDDVLIGNLLNNALYGGTGNDWIDGGAGQDSAVFAGRRGDYQLSTGFGKVFVAARDGVSGFDTLLGIEQLVFQDGALGLSTGAQGADAVLAVDQDARLAGSLGDAGSALTYAIVKGPANGTLNLSAAGAFEYVPRGGFASEDSFTFSVRDAGGASNTYMGFVAVRAVAGTPAGQGGPGADRLDGTGGNDVIDAAGGDDRINGSGGSDTLRGGEGRDTVAYQLARSAVKLTVGDGATVVKADGTDRLSAIERIEFSDAAVAFDIAGAAGQAYRVYQAAFDRKPDPAGLGYWIAQMDRGMSLNDVARGFTQSREFKDLYGEHPTSSELVTRLYQNVLHRAPEPAGFDYWLGALDKGYPVEELLAQFSTSPENQAQVIGAITGGIDYLVFAA